MYSRKHYLGVLGEAKKQLAGADMSARASACGYAVRKNTTGGVEIEVEYLGKHFRLDPAGLDAVSGGGRPMPLLMRIVVLHYLNGSGQPPLTGELVPLKKITELESYGPTIRWRTEDILVRAFGARPALLRETSERLGGAAVEIGDAGARLFPLPRVPMVISVNGEEEGIPADATVFYDKSITSVLPLEDAVVLAEIVSHKLANAARAV